MKRTEVESSNITSVGHEGTTLEIEFWNKKIYQYSPITHEAYMMMMKAESIGKWFHANIRNNDMIETKEITGVG